MRSPTAVYVPLRPVGAAPRAATLILQSESARFLSLAERAPDQKIVDEVSAELDEPLEGVVELSVERSDRRRAQLRQLNLSVVEDFVTFDYGARPRPLWLALAVFAVGLGGLALVVRRVRRWFVRVDPTLPRATFLS